MKQGFYKLYDVEFWEYRLGTLPVLRQDLYISNIYTIGKSYTVNDMSEIENCIIQYFQHLGFDCAIMNPLYPDKHYTVMSVDFYEVSILSDGKFELNSTEFISPDLNILIDLLFNHQNRLDVIFKTKKGKLSYTNKEGVYRSNDMTLQNIENKIVDILPRVLDEILECIQNNHINKIVLISILRFSYKDDKILLLFFDLLSKSNDVNELNLILLQLIPVVKSKKISNQHLDKLTYILLNKMLFFPSSVVRNKALALLSCFDVLYINDVEIINFIKLISKTKQLNCNYPARKIIKTLRNSSEGLPDLI